MSDEITIEDDETGTVQSIMTRAAGGDTSVLAELRQVLDDNPTLWRHLGNLATRTELTWIGMVTGHDLASAESLRRFVGAMKTDLVGQDPSPVMRLQGERVAIGWLQLQHADLVLANLYQRNGRPRQLESAVKRQQLLTRGYQKSLALLETVRRLLPMPQVPDGGGTPRTEETPTHRLPEPGAGVLPMPTEPQESVEPARRIAAEIRDRPVHRRAQ